MIRSHFSQVAPVHWSVGHCTHKSTGMSAGTGQRSSKCFPKLSLTLLAQWKATQGQWPRLLIEAAFFRATYPKARALWNVAFVLSRLDDTRLLSLPYNRSSDCNIDTALVIPKRSSNSSEAGQQRKKILYMVLRQRCWQELHFTCTNVLFRASFILRLCLLQGNVLTSTWWEIAGYSFTTA